MPSIVRRCSGLVRLAILVFALAATTGCGSLVIATADKVECTKPGPVSHKDAFRIDAKLTTTSSGLQYADISIGCGTTVKRGQSVALEYTGWLSSGREFDTSRQSGRPPLSFHYGEQEVIPGLDEGVVNMRVGGKRRLVIPAKLGFGAAGRGIIPGNATILLTVELIGVAG